MKAINGYWLVADPYIPRYKKPGKWDWLLRLIPPLFRKIEAKRPWQYKMFVIEHDKTILVHPDLYRQMKVDI